MNEIMKTTAVKHQLYRVLFVIHHDVSNTHIDGKTENVITH